MDLSKTENLRNARQLIAQGRVSAAIAIYQKIVDADCSDLSAVSMLSDLYIKAGRVSEAADHFLRIAESYLRNGSAISAAYILNKILKLDPANAGAHRNLGKMYLAEGKIDQAHSHFIEAGAAYWKKGDSCAAIEMNNQALAVMPDSQEAKTALAFIQQELEPPPTPEAPPQQQRQEPVYVELEPILISIPEEADQQCAARPSPQPCVEEERPDDLGESPFEQEPLPVLSEGEIFERFTTAELLVGYGWADQAIALLKETLQHMPDNIEVRAKLKDIYLRSEMNDRASEECVNIAGIYAAQGKTSLAQDYVIRARLLAQSVMPINTLAFMQTSEVNGVEEGQETSLEWSLSAKQPSTVM